MIDNTSTASPPRDATSLSRLFEVGAFFALRRSLTPALQWIAGRMGTVLPVLPVVKTAYLGFLTSVAVAAWLVWRGEKLSDYGLVKPRLKALGWGVLFFVAVVAYAVAVEPMLDAALEPILGRNHAPEIFASVRGRLDLFLFVLPFIWIFAAIGEEFFYRGYVMTRLTQALGGTRGAATIALFVQALLFGIAHLYQGPSAIVTTGIYGLAYGVAARVMGRNLWPAIIAHGLLDTLGFTLLYTGQM